MLAHAAALPGWVGVSENFNSVSIIVALLQWPVSFCVGLFIFSFVVKI